MSDPVFPLILPPQDQDSYSATQEAHSSMMNLDNGGRRFRAQQKEAAEAHSMKWTFTQAEYDIFVSFCRTMIRQYAEPFICRWDDGAGGLIAQRVVFAAMPRSVWNDDLCYEVSAELTTAGPPVGDFGYFVNVDGTSGGEDETGGIGGEQQPQRMIHLTNRTLRMATLNSPAYVAILLSGRVQTYDQLKGPNFIVLDEWKGAANTAPAADYSFARDLRLVDWRDFSGTKNNNFMPPTVFTGQDQNILQMSAPVNMITGNRTCAFQANNSFPYIKYELTIRITDNVSGHQEVGIYDIILGTVPT